MPVAPEAPAERFAGRRAELREVAASAAAAASGRRQVVVIEGRPGIGKTALLRRALAQLPDFGQLRADCGAAGRAVDQLTGEAERGSLTVPGPPSPGGLVATVRAMLDARGSLAIAIDNVHLVDGESAAEFSKMLFAFRTSRLLVVAAARDPWHPGVRDGPAVDRLRRDLLSVDEVTRLRLTELSVTETGQLLDRVGSWASEAAAQRLHVYTGGHPALLSALLDQGLTAAHAQPADLLGLFDPLVMSILRTVSSLPAPSRDLLAAMAVSDEAWPLAIFGSVARVEDPFEALEPLLDSGLVEWVPEQTVAPVSIRYPLYRDVIYRSLPAARREALHSRAASFALGARAWAHRVAAAKAADPGLAAMLESEAKRYYLAGDSKQAGKLLIWSAAATSDPRERERHLLQAARWWPTLRAVDWGPRLEACLSRTPASAPRSLVLGVLAEVAGHYTRALALLREASELARAEGSWTLLRAEVELAAALVYADLGDAETSLELAAGLLELEGLPAAHRGWAECHAADAVGRLNGPLAALAKLAVLVPDAGIDGANGDRDDAEASQSVRLWARGAWRLLSGRLHEGNQDLARMLRCADRAAVESIVPMAHAYMGYAHFLLGGWRTAEGSVAQAVGALNGHAVVRLRVPVYAIAACVDAATGRPDSAARNLQMAEYWHAESGPPDYAVFPALAAASIAQASGDYAHMLAALQPLVTSPDDGRAHETWWLPLQVEALIGTGQLGAARHALGRLTDVGGTPGRQAATVAWLRVWLAAAEHDELAARDGIEAAASRSAGHDDVPLHRARLEHEYGRYLMAGRNRRAAIGRLRRAYELYRELGAQPFAERCAADLAVCGAQPTAMAGDSGAGAAARALSPRERRIAYLAAQGLTNQEIASEVFISAKTVEYHLSNVFAKLGISSRRQLPARLGAEPGGRSTS